MSDENIIVGKNISKSFLGVKALKNIDITIEKANVLCLAGENGCGKSTLVKTLSGVYAPDSGSIILNGKTYTHLTSRIAINEGVQVIYQDLSLFQHMTVAENIAINKLIKNTKKIVNWKEIHEIASKQLEYIGVDIDLNATIQEISIANRQIVAISRALALEAKVLFMDEPTTALTKNEVERLLSIVMELKNRGLAIVFISHKLDEVFQIADKITVFRDGTKIGDFKSNELSSSKLAYYMTGREVLYPKYVRNNTNEKPLLEVKQLTKEGNYNNISFSCREGDIVGMIGLLGSGRTELAMSLFGLNPITSGDIFIDGKKVNINSPMDAKKFGIGLLPEDRMTEGLFLNKSVKDNISSTILNFISNKMGIINTKNEIDEVNKNVDLSSIKTSSINTIIKTLSGGNQQKAIISKWISTLPKIFIMDTPTVGIDIGSKSDIYKIIQSFAKKGMSIILISDEIEEIIHNCNRIIVVSKGEIISILENNENSVSNIGEMVSDMIVNPDKYVNKNNNSETV